jgi:hypothetical protein
MNRLFLFFIALSYCATSFGQVEILSPSAPVAIDFSTFLGNGFSPAPGPDQLDSDSWAIIGLSDGDMAFGGTEISGDFARGSSAGGVTSGGIYGYTGSTDGAIWIQPTGSDFSPGSITLKLCNQTGIPMTNLLVDYDVLILNDQDRANSFNFSWSLDDALYVNVPASDILSIELQDASLTTESRAINIAGISVADTDCMYLRWTAEDVSGGGSRDEFGLTNINLEFPGGPAIPAFQFATSVDNILEDGASYSVSVSLPAPADCDIEIALDAVGSSATEGLDFTYPATTTLNFTSAGSATMSLSVPIIDDLDTEPSEIASFILQNPTGPDGCILGAITTLDLTILDNEVVTSGPCADLFFSEYVEGSSNNKAIEIINPTSFSIDLSTYTVNNYPNGASSVGSSLTLSGTLMPGGVYTIVNPSADPLLLAVADTTSTVTFYNGNDALELVNGSVAIDVIGDIGVFIATCWPVGSGAMCENTLVRSFATQQGDTDWLISAGSWDVLPADDFSNFGMHSYLTCGGTSPVISFIGSTASISEPGGVIDLELSIVNPASTDMDVDVIISTASDASTADHDFVPVTLTFPASSTASMMLSFNVLDDLIAEGTELLILQLDNATTGVIFGVDEYTITILDDEFSTVDIVDVTEETADGTAVSLGDQVSINGVVYGIDIRGGDGLQFTIIDGTGGIGFFSLNNEFGYTVLETDEIRVDGTINQFNGLTQIDPDTIIFLSSSASLKTPTVVTDLGEVTESDLVKLENLELVDAAQWLGDGSSFNVDVTDGTGTWVMRIDDQVDLASMTAPSGKFHLTGLGGQFDPASPFDEGYQIFPRYAPDIELVIEDTTGTGLSDNNPMLEIGLYPNPVSNGEVQIASDQIIDQIEVFDLQGSLKLLFEPNSKNAFCKLEGLSNGTYLVRVKTANNIGIKKLVLAAFE